MNKSSKQNKPTKKQKNNKNKNKKPINLEIVRKIRGKGDYFDDIVNFGKKAWSNLNESETREGASAFNQAVNSLGNAVGEPFGIGKQLGNAGSWLSRIFGMGKYTIKKNSLLSDYGFQVHNGLATTSTPPPTFSSTSKGSDIVFAHSEYIADVKSSINFSKTTYAINPGNNLAFPWLSKIASLYEEYQLLGLVAEYRPTSGMSNTSAVPGMGIVVMATDYDVYDDAFNTKRSMEAAEFATPTVPYSNALHAIECDPKRNVLKMLYVQPGLTRADQAPGDWRFSFPCNFTIATEGQQADGVAMGELHFTYHIKLSRPILESQSPTGFTQLTNFDSLVVQPDSPAFDFHTTKVSGGVPFLFTATNSKRLEIHNDGHLGMFHIFIAISAPTDDINLPSSVSTIYSEGCLPLDIYGSENNQPTHCATGAKNVLENPNYHVTSICVEFTKINASVTFAPVQDSVTTFGNILITSLGAGIRPVLSGKDKQQAEEQIRVNKMLRMLVESNKELEDKYNRLQSSSSHSSGLNECIKPNYQSNGSPYLADGADENDYHSVSTVRPLTTPIKKSCLSLGVFKQ